MNATQVVRILVLAVLMALAAGCASTGEVPIGVLRYENPAKPTVGGKKLLIFLRGIGVTIRFSRTMGSSIR